MSGDKPWLKASCLCGAVKFSVKDEFLYAGYCHCSECRKFSGSANSVAGGVKTDHVRIEHLTGLR